MLFFFFRLAYDKLLTCSSYEHAVNWAKKWTLDEKCATIFFSRCVKLGETEGVNIIHSNAPLAGMALCLAQLSKAHTLSSTLSLDYHHRAHWPHPTPLPIHACASHRCVRNGRTSARTASTAGELNYQIGGNIAGITGENACLQEV